MTFNLDEWVRDRCSILSIDPGSGGTGIACWDFVRWNRDLLPVHVGNVFAAGGKNLKTDSRNTLWQSQAADITAKVYDIIQATNAQQAYVEYPLLMGSAGGNAAAGTGSLVKLAVLVGMIMETCRVSGIPVIAYPVSEWKGQCSKEIIEKRIRKRVGEGGWASVGAKSHMIDAWGLGLFAKNMLHLGQEE